MRRSPPPWARRSTRCASARPAAMSTRAIPARSAPIRAATARSIIVVEDVADLWALERATAMNARYHVLGGTLSPLDGIGPDDLNIKTLVGAGRRGRRQRSDHRGQRYGRRPDDGALPHRPAFRLRRPGDAARAWRAGRRRARLSRRGHARRGAAARGLRFDAICASLSSELLDDDRGSSLANPTSVRCRRSRSPPRGRCPAGRGARSSSVDDLVLLRFLSCACPRPSFCRQGRRPVPRLAGRRPLAGRQGEGHLAADLRHGLRRRHAKPRISPISSCRARKPRHRRSSIRPSSARRATISPKRPSVR